MPNPHGFSAAGFTGLWPAQIQQVFRAVISIFAPQLNDIIKGILPVPEKILLKIF